VLRTRILFNQLILKTKLITLSLQLIPKRRSKSLKLNSAMLNLVKMKKILLDRFSMIQLQEKKPTLNWLNSLKNVPKDKKETEMLTKSFLKLLLFTILTTSGTLSLFQRRLIQSLPPISINKSMMWKQWMISKLNLLVSQMVSIGLSLTLPMTKKPKRSTIS